VNYPVPFNEPRQNAAFLDNVRVNKFISEFQQMINRAIFVYGGNESQLLNRKNGNIYGVKGHVHHPCTLWIQANKSNFLHAIESTLAFYKEHIARGGKGHENVPANMEKAKAFADKLPEGNLTPFANCAAASALEIDYKHIGDVHLAYRMYYAVRWKTDKRKPKWGYRK